MDQHQGLEGILLSAAVEVEAAVAVMVVSEVVQDRSNMASPEEEAEEVLRKERVEVVAEVEDTEQQVETFH